MGDGDERRSIAIETAVVLWDEAIGSLRQARGTQDIERWGHACLDAVVQFARWGAMPQSRDWLAETLVALTARADTPRQLIDRLLEVDKTLQAPE